MNAQLLGDSCLCLSLGRTISAATSRRVLSLYRALKRHPSLARLGVLDVVPAYNSVAIYFDALDGDIPAIRALAYRLLARPPQARARAAGRRIVLPVRYDGEDLDRVAAHTGLTAETVSLRHAAGLYTVAMIGFLPHFPYLIGLPRQLATPRLDTPRLRVPAGAVAIGGSQTGVYPCESPGGWNLIGVTDPKLLISMQPGDRVVFERI